MKTLTKPQVLPAPIADIGLKNVIPNNPTGTYRASVKGGFPAMTMKAKADGGVPPDGKDLNGFYNILSQFYFYTQNGGVFTFDQSVSNAIGGYPQGAVLYWKHDNVIEKVESQIENNTYNFVTTPSYIDGTKWKIVTETDLNGKADRNLSNVISGAFENVVATAQASGKRTVRRWGIPDYSAGVSVNGKAGYTATADGIVFLFLDTAENDDWTYVYCNGHSVAMAHGKRGRSNGDGTAVVPVKVGDVITAGSNFNSASGYFYPFI